MLFAYDTKLIVYDRDVYKGYEFLYVFLYEFSK